MPATISVNFANQVEVEGSTPPTNKSVNASVLKSTLVSGNVAGGYLRLNAGAVNQDVQGSVSIKNGDNQGKVLMNAGNASASGFVAWFRPDGVTRMAYMGWNPDGATNLALNLENGARFRIMGNTGNVKIDGNLEVGSLTIGSSVNPTVPVGAVMAFATDAPPTGWLRCNGDGIPNGSGTVQGITANFAALFAILNGAFGTISGQNRLPNIEGVFVRGSGSQTVDGVAHSGTFAQTQAQDFQSHGHTGSTNEAGWHAHYFDRRSAINNRANGGGFTAHGHYEGAWTGGAGNHTHTVTVNAAGGTETRPPNISLLYCIKY